MTPAGFRVAVAGGRAYQVTAQDEHALDAVRTLLAAAGGWAVMLHGGATGADTGAATWARARGIPCVSFHVEDALWRSVGPAALLRNADMLVAFPGGDGTASTVKEATRRRLFIVHLTNHRYVVRRMSFDSPPKPYWKVIEIVGHHEAKALTIEWEDLYGSKEAAEDAARRTR